MHGVAGSRLRRSLLSSRRCRAAFDSGDPPSSPVVSVGLLPGLSRICRYSSSFLVFRSILLSISSD